MHLQRDRTFRVAAEILAAAAALALLTWGADRLGLRSGPAAVLYVVLVVLVSLRGSLAPALVVAVGGTVAWDYFFTAPAVTLPQRQFRDVVTLVAFCATAVMITRLVMKLRASEGRWRNVFENNPTMYFMIDGSGIVRSVNPTGAEQLGYAAAELVGQPVLNVFLEEEKAAARDHVARCLAHVGQSMSWELRKVRKDGTMLWVRETARAVQLGTEPPVVLIACEDVTERNATQENLRRSEARLRGQASLLDLTHDAIFVCDLNNVIVYWNRGAEQLYGWTSDEALGRATHELLQTDFPEPLGDLNATLLQTGRWDGELVHTKRDGTRVVVASRWSLQRDAHGQPAGVLKTNSDITERKRAEEEHRSHLWFLESMDRVNRAMQGANDIEQMMNDVLGVTLSIFACDQVMLVYPCDPDATSTRIVMARTRPEFSFVDEQGLEGAPISDERARAIRALVVAAGPVRFDAGTEPPLTDQTTKLTGVRSLLGLAIHPKVDAAYMFVMGQCSHVRIWTEPEERLFQEIGRRLADALTSLLVLRDLRESARRYRNIFQTAAVSIWEQDFSGVRTAIEELRARGISDFRRYFAEHPEFVAHAVQLVRIVDVNDATIRMFGAATRDELLMSLHTVFTPETLDVFAGELLAVAEGRTSFAAETTLRTLNGERLDLLVTIAFPPEPTNFESVLVSIMDVTARKRAEEALRTAQTELARASTLTTMGQLAASIAHELRQPLAAIAMNGSASLRWLNRETPDLEEVREAATRIVREAQRADEVIRGLRALVSKSGMQREPLDMNDAVHEVLELARGELRRNTVSVHAELTPALHSVLGDRVQLQQVVLNLVVNAIEAMALVADRPKTLVIRTERAASGQVAVTVEDSGPGLDPAGAQRIFDPFFTTKANGLGLGLSICRSIVEAHGGELTASPRSPHGTTFRFTVPETATATRTSPLAESQHPRIEPAADGVPTT